MRDLVLLSWNQSLLVCIVVNTVPSCKGIKELKLTRLNLNYFPTDLIIFPTFETWQVH